MALYLTYRIANIELALLDFFVNGFGCVEENLKGAEGSERLKSTKRGKGRGRKASFYPRPPYGGMERKEQDLTLGEGGGLAAPW